MEKGVEIIEYVNWHTPIYEVMLAEEFDKKMRGENYEVLRSSDTIPFARVNTYDTNTFWTKKEMSYEEAKNKFKSL